MLESTVRALTSAGWAPGRRADTAPFTKALLDAGYEVFPKLVEFLAEFGGLSISGSGSVTVRFDVPQILASLRQTYDDEGLDEYASRVGMRWSLIGIVSMREPTPNAQDWDLTLMITDKGIVHGVGDGYEQVAGSVDDETLMDNLCRGLWAERIDWRFEPAPGYPRVRR